MIFDHAPPGISWLSKDSAYQSIQFWSGFIPVNGGGWIYPTLAAISPAPTLHLARFNASSFFKPTFLLSFSTCIFHLFCSRPHFLFPFTSNSNAFLKTCPYCTISLQSPLQSEPLFPSIPTSPLSPLSYFSPSVLHHNKT